MDETNPEMGRCLKDISLSDISDKEWKEIWQKLRVFVQRKYGNLGKLVGLDLDDIVQQAILDTLEGRRTWPPTDKDVSIFVFLTWVIRSNISNILNKAESNVLVWPSDQISIPEDYHPGTSQSKLPEQQAISKELLEKVHETVGDDEFLMKVLEKLMLNFKPKQIAEELGVDIVEVRKAQKRLNKRIKKLRESLQAPMLEGAILAR
jgi:RNA polymerase sigma factor (sigma-70 family)